MNATDLDVTLGALVISAVEDDQIDITVLREGRHATARLSRSDVQGVVDALEEAKEFDE